MYTQIQPFIYPLIQSISPLMQSIYLSIQSIYPPTQSLYPPTLSNHGIPPPIYSPGWVYSHWVTTHLFTRWTGWVGAFIHLPHPSTHPFILRFTLLSIHARNPSIHSIYLYIHLLTDHKLLFLKSLYHTLDFLERKNEPSPKAKTSCTAHQSLRTAHHQNNTGLYVHKSVQLLRVLLPEPGASSQLYR